MPIRIAPAASSALAQATALAPSRSRASDGLVGDSAHKDRRSFHNPSYGDGVWKDDGVVLAFDVTHDPTDGFDAHREVRAAVARRDRRILEAISRGQIWTKARAAEGWRPYGGDNPHDRHAHVSIVWAWRNDTASWWRRPTEEDDLTPEQDARLKRIEQKLDALTAPRLPGGADRDPGRIDLGDVLNDDKD